MNQHISKTKELESQLFFKWINDLELKSQLTKKVNNAKAKRFETQKELAKLICCSLTKIKEIETGTCKDFNSINNYLNYYSEYILTKL